MTMPQHPHTPWWKEPMVWLILSLPAASVTGGLITIWLAASGADPMVRDDYYKQGLALHQSEERAAHAAAAGLSAAIEADRERITVRLSGRLQRYPERLNLSVVHPTRAEQDRNLSLPTSSPGVYRAELPPLSPGRRQLILEPEDQYWRLVGHWTAPFAGRVLIETAAGDPAKQP